jgi:hypothetical protein
MNPMMMNRIEGQTFVGANVQIDGGVVYVKCKFVNCTLVVTGAGPVQLMDCQIDTTCRWTFAGPAANLISFLKASYEQGGREMVEALFREIRGESVAQPPEKTDKKGGGPTLQ